MQHSTLREPMGRLDFSPNISPIFIGEIYIYLPILSVSFCVFLVTNGSSKFFVPYVKNKAGLILSILLSLLIADTLYKLITFFSSYE